MRNRLLPSHSFWGSEIQECLFSPNGSTPESGSCSQMADAITRRRLRWGTCFHTHVVPEMGASTGLPCPASMAVCPPRVRGPREPQDPTVPFPTWSHMPSLLLFFSSLAGVTESGRELHPTVGRARQKLGDIVTYHTTSGRKWTCKIYSRSPDTPKSRPITASAQSPDLIV